MYIEDEANSNCNLKKHFTLFIVRRFAFLSLFLSDGHTLLVHTDTYRYTHRTTDGCVGDNVFGGVAPEKGT